MSNKPKTEIEKVTDWNKKHSVGDEVELSINGKPKITDHKCVTTTPAYLNQFQRAVAILNVETLTESIEVSLNHINPI